MSPYSVILVTILTFFSADGLVAQKGDRHFRDRYAADLNAGETEVATTYQWMLSRTANKHYVLRTYFPETKELVAFETFTDRRLRNQSGPARYYYDDGTLYRETVYRDNQQHGPFTEYHRNGQIGQEGTYERGEKTGPWTSYYKDGQLSMTSTYVVGDLDGEQVSYDTLGAATSRFYRAGDEIGADGQVIVADTTGKTERLPLFPGCNNFSQYTLRKKCADAAMLQYVYGNVRYPERARQFGVQGTAVISFVIDKDGSVTDVESIQGVSEDIRDEVMRLVGTFPTWEPGMENGEPVRVQFFLPVNFQLE